MRTNSVSASISGLEFEGPGGAKAPTLGGISLRGQTWVRCSFTASSAATTGQATILRTSNNLNGYLDISAEF